MTRRGKRTPATTTDAQDSGRHENGAAGRGYRKTWGQEVASAENSSKQLTPTKNERMIGTNDSLKLPLV
jgi:hypothetical protein